MTARVDLDGLLALRRRIDGWPLPFAVRATGQVPAPAVLLHDVRSAIDHANTEAAGRSATDPTWGGFGDLVGSEVRAELGKGHLTEDEVRRWFADLAEGLERLDVSIAPLEPDRAEVPALDDWRTMPPAVTAFLSFTADVDGRRRTTPPSTVRQTADALADWTRLPGATTVVWRGVTSFVVPPGTAADELRTSAEVEEQHALWQVSATPRRARAVDFTYRAKGFLQVVDESRSAVDCLPEVLSGLRILAPYVDYAWVRRATSAGPDERDTVIALGRQPTAMEELAGGRRALHLLHDYVVDAYVAQVLTSAHLERAGTLDGYDVEPLGSARHLVVARNPDAWLSGLDPDPVALARGREGLSGALLTPEVVAANPAF